MPATCHLRPIAPRPFHLGAFHRPELLQLCAFLAARLSRDQLERQVERGSSVAPLVLRSRSWGVQ